MNDSARRFVTCRPWDMGNARDVMNVHRQVRALCHAHLLRRRPRGCSTWLRKGCGIKKDRRIQQKRERKSMWRVISLYRFFLDSAVCGSPLRRQRGGSIHARVPGPPPSARARAFMLPVSSDSRTPSQETAASVRFACLRPAAGPSLRAINARRRFVSMMSIDLSSEIAAPPGDHWIAIVTG